MSTDAAPRPYRGRLAPSPTGGLHLGHARTFMLAWLRARAQGGELLLRIEDLDTPRVVPGSTEQICDELRWLGIDWDGSLERQSDRQELYRAALTRLREANLVYPCSCSRRDIAALVSAPHGDTELGLRYPGTCRKGVACTDRAPSLRFRDPTDSKAGPDDFVVRRADGVWTYQLAVAVDDGEQGITEVVRGADLASSTGRQRALLSVLHYSVPTYLHVPLLLDSHGKRFAKRDGTGRIATFRARGTAPEAVIGFLAATLGLGDGQPVPLGALVADMGSARISSAPSQVSAASIDSLS